MKRKNLVIEKDCAVAKNKKGRKIGETILI